MKSLDDLEVAGRTVLVRADFNVPLADGPGGPDDTVAVLRCLYDNSLDLNHRG